MGLVGKVFAIIALTVVSSAAAQDHRQPAGSAAPASAVAASTAPDGPSRIQVDRKRRAVRSGPPASVLPPEASGDTYSTAHNTQLSEPAPGVLADDVLRGATLVSYGATGGEQTALGVGTFTTQAGTIRMEANGSFVYNPAAGFSGSDSFRYTIANTGGSSSATVMVTVAPEAPVVDFVVTSPGFFFVFSGVSGQNPVLQLTRGRTYRFQVNTSSIHPFQIVDAPEGSVTNNNINVGILTFTVPATAADYRYRCSLHEFGNVIQTVPPSSAAISSEQLEKNRRTVLSFFDLAFLQARPREAMERFGGDSYVRHGAPVPEGREGFISWVEEEARQYPGRVFEILQVFGEGPLVAIHTLQRDADASSRRAVDIFRVDGDGRVVEHWGVAGPGATPGMAPEN